MTFPLRDRAVQNHPVFAFQNSMGIGHRISRPVGRGDGARQALLAGKLGLDVQGAWLQRVEGFPQNGPLFPIAALTVQQFHNFEVSHFSQPLC